MATGTEYLMMMAILACMLLVTSTQPAEYDIGCEDWLSLPGYLTTGGDEFIRLDEAADARACKAACINTRTFQCAAAMTRGPSTCYLTGYMMRDNYWSTHFYRTCTGGPHCYRSERGVSFKNAVSIPIPAPYRFDTYARALYCMAECEKEITCIGFDLIEMGSKIAKCAPVHLGMVRNHSFDVLVSRC